MQNGTGCWQSLSDRSKSARGERPWLYLSGRCRFSQWDSSLIRRCHLRRKQRSRVIPACPGGSAKKQPQGARSLREIKQKYSRWANASWCDHGTNVHWTVSRTWWRLHKCILVTIFRTWLAYLRPGHLVLDWGSGCGYKLDWAQRLFGIDGVGVELLHASVAWANDNVAGRNCQADGRNLSWLPDDTFDAVISFAALYHLHGEEQCNVVGQLVEKLRHGGRAWLGWMSPYVWYKDVYRKGHFLSTDTVARNCPDGGSPSPGWAAVCDESARHMIPPQPSWDACFARLRRHQWAKLGVNATFHWKREVDLFVDPRDRATVQSRSPENLAGYSLFIEKLGPKVKSEIIIPKSSQVAFFMTPLSRNIRTWIMKHGTQAGLSAPSRLSLSMSTYSFYLHGKGEPSLRRAIRGMFRHPWLNLKNLLQANLLATEFMLADRLRRLGMAPPDNPHVCALPILESFLQYQEMRHSFHDSKMSPHSNLLDIGERRVKLGIKSLWRQVLDSSKSWTAAVGSLGFCDCAKDAVKALDNAVSMLGMYSSRFASNFDDPYSQEVTKAKQITGCDEQWAFSASFPLEERIRPFTSASAASRWRCSINIATFASICSQYYLAVGDAHAARRALQFAAFITVLGGDCIGEGSPPPPLRSVDILYNHARAQRFASLVHKGEMSVSVMAWRPSLHNATVMDVSSGPNLDDAVPRNFAGGNRDASVGQAASGAWICDLSSCRDRLPQFLKGAMQHRPTDAAMALQKDAKRRLAALVSAEKTSQRSQCHPLSEDTQRFLEQRIEALVMQSSGQKQCEPYRAPYMSTWHTSDLVEVRAPKDIPWRLSTLVPVPWSTLETLHPSIQASVLKRYPQFHFDGNGPRSINISETLTGSIEVHALELQISGLDQTRCTKHVEVHVRAHRLPPFLLGSRMTRRSGLNNNFLNFAVVVLDSTIAHAWDIFCPKVLAELAKYEEGHFSHEAFRFHGHHALLDPECDCLTGDNMISFFSGRRVPRSWAVKRRIHMPVEGMEEYQTEMDRFRFLWHEMQDAGYVTLSADDSCSRSPLNVCDPAYNFFDAYAPTFAGDPSSCTHDVFCRHRELFDYAAEWMDLHSDVPHLAYLHLDGTHGTRPESLVHYDAEIAEWVHGRLRASGGENLVVIIMSDHGVQSGDGHLTSQPFLTALLPQKLLLSIGEKARQALRMNTKRLSTNYDMHFTLQQMLHFNLAAARGLQVSSLAASRRPLENTTSPNHVVRNLFFPLPEERSCDDAGLLASRCFCSASSLPWQSFHGSGNDLQSLAEQLVRLLNVRARMNVLGDTVDMTVCRLHSLRSVEAARMRSDGSSIEIIAVTEPFGLLWKGIAYANKDVADDHHVMSGVEQITRYFPHEHCTPSGMDPKFCACNANVIHRLNHHDHFWHDWPSLPPQ